MPTTISFAGDSTTTQRKSSIYQLPSPKRQKMSITQTYFLAHSARSKLSREASRADHDLRLLVGHANMLDHLMIDLANAEQEQERLFNKSLHDQEAVKQHEPVSTEEEEEEEAEEYELDDESDSEDAIIQPIRSDDDIEVDDEQDIGLALVRTVSHVSSGPASPPNSPPELTMEADSDSEDEPMPPSPPSLSLNDFIPAYTKKVAVDDLGRPHHPTIIAAY